MFNALFWMLKQENFKKHFVYLLSIYLICLSIAGILIILNKHFVSDSLIQFIILFVIIGLYICPFLCFQGYFWTLTENIIYRQIDISSSSIYNGKVKEIYRIELPEIKTGKFIWRGIASIVASILLCYPFIVLVLISTMSSFDALSFYNASTMVLLYVILFILVGLLIPALLWNYAKQDSIFAVWNFPKAIHIMGTYFGKYLWNTILFLVFMFIQYCISSFLAMILGFGNFDLASNSVFKSLLFLIFEYAISIYFIYVNAYLLGTIAPPNEG